MDHGSMDVTVGEQNYVLYVTMPLPHKQHEVLHGLDLDVTIDAEIFLISEASSRQLLI